MDGGREPTEVGATVLEQVLWTLDPQHVRSRANQSPDEMGIAPARLFEQAFEQTRLALTITDPHRPGNPIVFTNQAFERLTGYGRDEIVGRNCRFLQGPDTDPKAVARVRDALQARSVAVVPLLNYRKDGSAFWNALHVGPILDEEGRLTHFYGSQWDMTETIAHAEEAERQARVNAELRHRTGNLFAVFSGLLHLSSREASTVRELSDVLRGRIGALARAHRLSLPPGEDDPPTQALEGFVGTILEPYEARLAGRIALSGPPVTLPAAKVTPMGLTLHELATNALKHGALAQPEGSVEVSWSVAEGTLRLRWSERADAAPPEGSGSGTGLRIIKAILNGVDGTIDRERHARGLDTLIKLPLG